MSEDKTQDQIIDEAYREVVIHVEDIAERAAEMIVEAFAEAVAQRFLAKSEEFGVKVEKPS